MNAALRFAAAGFALAACVAPTATPSPTPTTTAPTASVTPSASAAPTATPSPTIDPARLGFVVGTNGRIVVRSERSGDPILAIAGDRPSVSHDGKRIAFWRMGPQGGNPPQLRIAELPGGAERLVLTVVAGSIGGAIVWSNDDTGLLYEIDSAQLNPGAGGGPRFSRLESVDLGAASPQAATHPDLALSDGRVIVPVAWDNAGRTASALITGEGGQGIAYVRWDRAPGVTQNVVKRTPFPWTVIADSVRASHDEKRILAIDIGANVLRVWPIADITQAGMVGASGRIVDASWRAGVPGDIAWVVEQTVSVFSYQSDNARVIHRGQSFVLIQGWRVDGSAVVIHEQGIRGALIVDVATQQATEIPEFGAALGGGVLLR